MSDVSDEVLMAYVDGELDEDRGEEIAAALANDAALRTRAELFRSTRLPVQAAFDDVLAQPVPPRLLALVRGGPVVAAETRSQREASLRHSVSARQGFSGRHALMRVAASVALLLLAGAAGWLLHAGTSRQAASRDFSMQVAARLQQLLEAMPSGAQLVVSDERTPDDAIRATSSFVGTDGRFCRQYELALGREAFAGVACRTARGWFIEHQARQVQATATQKGLGTASERPGGALDRAIEAMIEGGLLDADEEYLLLQSGWTAKLPKR